MTCPDAETLAQFAEGSLPEFAREGLLEHLASCDACREAALVLVPEKRPTERRNLKPRKGFAWGPWFAAAAVLLAAGIVWKRLPHKVEQAPPVKVVAANEQPAPPPTKVPESAQPAAPTPAAPKPPAEPAPLPPANPPSSPPSEPAAPEDHDPLPKPPTNAVAIPRLLDLQGRLVADGKPVAEGAAVATAVSAPDGAGFHLEGHAMALAKGASLSYSRDWELLNLDVKGGELFIEPRGPLTIRVAGENTALSGPALVTEKGVAELRDKAVEKARSRFAKQLPTRRTLVFEDFAGEKNGVLQATAQGGPIVGARVQVQAGATWSKKLSVRVRYRTAAKTVQVGLVFKDPSRPWAAMPSAKAGAWQELIVKAADFSAGPMGGASPAEGDAVTFVTFAINTEEPGSAGASLELDDLALILEE